MTHFTRIGRLFFNALVAGVISAGFVSCSDDDSPAPRYPLAISDTMPEGVPSTAAVTSGSLVLTELNTRVVSEIQLPMPEGTAIPAGTYNVEGNMTVKYPSDGAQVERSLRAVASQVVISSTAQSLSLNWFYLCLHECPEAG